jgi:hypothetical protein
MAGKGSKQAPGCPEHDITERTTLVKTRLRRMQYRPALLEGFLASTGLDLTPFSNPNINNG